jgi:hypothetical protein
MEMLNLNLIIEDGTGEAVIVLEKYEIIYL